jgi:hypothetical protein
VGDRNGTTNKQEQEAQVIDGNGVPVDYKAEVKDEQRIKSEVKQILEEKSKDAAKHYTLQERELTTKVREAELRVQQFIVIRDQQIGILVAVAVVLLVVLAAGN